ncbi:MAG: hypothetical protein OXI86_19000 [Candidatus Poribacteria bacterium]|nr:hypothetical protein [Candidatus Poribacteria bacterium]
MVSTTDRAVIAICGMMLLAFWLYSQFALLWIIHINCLIAAILFGYAIWKERETSRILERSVLFGVVASLTYIPLDWGLSHGIQFIIYLRSDLAVMPAAPLCVVFAWMIAITVIIYLYCRLNSMAAHAFVSAGIAGIAAFAGVIVIDQFASAQFLWHWNSTPLGGRYRVDFPQIGSTPVFVPVSLLLTFVLSPYYFYKRQHTIVAGIRCGVFMGTMLFCGFVVFLALYRDV